jgi:hypothetical protein
VRGHVDQGQTHRHRLNRHDFRAALMRAAPAVRGQRIGRARTQRAGPCPATCGVGGGCTYAGDRRQGMPRDHDFGEFIASIAGQVMKLYMFCMRLWHSGTALHFGYANQTQEERFWSVHSPAVPGRMWPAWHVQSSPSSCCS